MGRICTLAMLAVCPDMNIVCDPFCSSGTSLTAASGESFDDVPHEKRQIGKIAIISCLSGQLSNNYVSQDSLAQCSSSSIVLSELGA